MADMFNRETVLGGVMSAEATRVNFSGTGLDSEVTQKGLIMQQLQVEYKQNVTRLYALEDAKVYFVAGRTEGTFTIQHVIGPQGLLTEFLKSYGDVCKIGNQVLNLSTLVGCGSQGGAIPGSEKAVSKASSVVLKAPCITAFGLQMQAGNMVIASTLTGMFVSLEIKEQGGNEGLLIDKGAEGAGFGLSTSAIGA